MPWGHKSHSGPKVAGLKPTCCVNIIILSFKNFDAKQANFGPVAPENTRRMIRVPGILCTDLLI